MTMNSLLFCVWISSMNGGAYRSFVMCIDRYIFDCSIAQIKWGETDQKKKRVTYELINDDENFSIWESLTNRSAQRTLTWIIVERWTLLIWKIKWNSLNLLRAARVNGLLWIQFKPKPCDTKKEYFFQVFHLHLSLTCTHIETSERTY